jgi:hypothetical protein
VTAADVSSGELVNRAIASGPACDPAIERRDRGPGRVAACLAVSDADTVSVAVRSSGGLPGTGSPVRPTTPLLALGMLGLGATLLFAGRRRRD